jgi:catechol 2,3-dioxygenase-like lactoylglutathione lyase family enzyme
VRALAARIHSHWVSEVALVSISIDVPVLADAVRFYSSAFGFSEVAAPVAGVIVLQAGNVEICLLQKDVGTRPSSRTQELRRYERHWTPLHLDIHVDDLESAPARALADNVRSPHRIPA